MASTSSALTHTYALIHIYPYVRWPLIPLTPYRGGIPWQWHLDTNKAMGIPRIIYRTYRSEDGTSFKSVRERIICFGFLASGLVVAIADVF